MSAFSSAKSEPLSLTQVEPWIEPQDDPSGLAVILLVVFPNGWQRCASTAIEAYRFVADREVLQIVFVEGRQIYDYPCSGAIYERFVGSSSKGRFVNEVLKPYAQGRGWSVTPYAWTAW